MKKGVYVSLVFVVMLGIVFMAGCGGRPAPDVPRFILQSPGAGAEIQPRGVFLAWEFQAGRRANTVFHLFLAEQNGEYPEEPNAIVQGQSHWLDLPANKHYQWYVVAFQGDEELARSPEWTFSTIDYAFYIRSNFWGQPTTEGLFVHAYFFSDRRPEHIWVNGPGIQEDSFDLVSESFAPSPAYGAYPNFQDGYIIKTGDRYEFRFVFDNDEVEIREAIVGDLEPRYHNMLQPQENQQYSSGDDVEVRWNLPDGASSRQVAVDHFRVNIYKLPERDYIPFDGDIQIVNGEYIATLPGSLFDTDGHYDIQVNRWVSYPGIPAYQKFIATRVRISVGEVEPSFRHQVYADLWETSNNRMLLEVFFDFESDTEGLQHIWVEGPGVPQGFDLIVEQEPWTQDNPRVFVKYLSYTPVKDDEYEFRLVYSDRDEIIRQAVIGNTDPVYITFMAPEPWQTFAEPQDVVVQWQQPEGLANRTIAHQHFNLWVDVVNEGYSEGFEIPPPDQGVYTVTIPASFFAMDKQYRINVRWQVKFEGNDHYMRMTSTSQYIRVGEFEDFALYLTVFVAPDSDDVLRTTLQPVVEIQGPILKDDVDKAIIKGPGIVDGGFELRRGNQYGWWDHLNDYFHMNIEEGWVFQTGHEYYVELHLKPEAQDSRFWDWGSRDESTREGVIIVDAVTLGNMPDNSLQFTHDWRTPDWDNPHPFEAPLDLNLQWEYDGEDVVDFTLILFNRTHGGRDVDIKLNHSELEYSIPKEDLAQDTLYLLEVRKDWGYDETRFRFLRYDCTWFVIGDPDRSAYRNIYQYEL